MATQRAFVVVWRQRRISEATGGVQCQLHTMLLPVDISWISVLAEDSDRRAVDHHSPLLLVQVLDDPVGPASIEIVVQSSIH